MSSHGELREMLNKATSFNLPPRFQLKKKESLLKFSLVFLRSRHIHVIHVLSDVQQRRIGEQVKSLGLNISPLLITYIVNADKNYFFFFCLKNVHWCFSLDPFLSF